MKIEANIFKNNYAASTGGAISWSSIEPSNVLNNTFTDNKAQYYGNNISGIGFRIIQITEDIFKENSNKDGDIRPINADPFNSGVTSYLISNTTYSADGISSGSTLPTMYFAIIDNYNYIYKSGETKTLKIEIKSSSNSSIASIISGTPSLTSTVGLFNFENLVVYSEPGKPQNFQVVDFDRKISNQVNITFTPRKWSVGEQMSSKGV